MKRLCELTGMSRQAIHFYIQKGLVPPGRRRGRTSAVYTDEHVERIRAVRRMQREEFLPLDAIRATFDRRDEGFTAAQRRVIAGVRERFSVRDAPKQPTVGARAAARRAGLDDEDLEALVELGLLTPRRDARGRRRIPRHQTWVLASWKELRDAGFDRARGFSPADLAMYVEAMDALVVREASLLSTRLADLPAEQTTAMLSRAMPVVGALLARLHDAAARRFLAQGE